MRNVLQFHSQVFQHGLVRVSNVIAIDLLLFVTENKSANYREGTSIVAALHRSKVVGPTVPKLRSANTTASVRRRAATGILRLWLRFAVGHKGLVLKDIHSRWIPCSLPSARSV
eukprot:COSAG02_NODE_2550_length_8554_cov_67.309639_9_plen_114_part_00